MSSLTDETAFVIGVDTHVATHAAAIVNAATGAVIAQQSVSADERGYADLAAWADSYPGARVRAIEGTGCHGAGLTRHLTGAGEAIIEIDRPARVARRHSAKSDPLDAIRAAREALAREHNITPRTGGDRRALAVLRTARASAIQGATDTARQIFAIVIAAPPQLRDRFTGKPTRTLLKRTATLRQRPTWDTETATTATTAATLKTLATRALNLYAEADTYEQQIHAIITRWRPDLLAINSVGTIGAATLLCA